MNTDPLVHDGPVRTDLYCHACGKNFIAELDYSLDGQHEIWCPHCQHIHYRIIEAGKVTGERHDSDDHGSRNHLPLRIWKHDVLPVQTSSASDFIRQKWLARLI